MLVIFIFSHFCLSHCFFSEFHICLYEKFSLFIFRWLKHTREIRLMDLIINDCLKEYRELIVDTMGKSRTNENESCNENTDWNFKRVSSEKDSSVSRICAWGMREFFSSLLVKDKCKILSALPSKVKEDLH